MAQSCSASRWDGLSETCCGSGCFRWNMCLKRWEKWGQWGSDVFSEVNTKSTTQTNRQVSVKPWVVVTFNGRNSWFRLINTLSTLAILHLWCPPSVFPIESPCSLNQTPRKRHYLQLEWSKPNSQPGRCWLVKIHQGKACNAQSMKRIDQHPTSGIWAKKKKRLILVVS